MSAARARALLPATLLLLAGCATVTPREERAFREHPPRSILILPPLNESTHLEGSYRCLSTLSRPVAERGYYVFPVAVVDALLKDSALATPGEMPAATLAKVRELTGADAVLLTVLHAYGRAHRNLDSDSVVRVSARLVDTRTGSLLWSGDGAGQSGTGNSPNLLGNGAAALQVEALSSNTDPGQQLCRLANAQLFETRRRELPYGPYHANFGR